MSVDHNLSLSRTWYLSGQKLQPATPTHTARTSHCAWEWLANAVVLRIDQRALLEGFPKQSLPLLAAWKIGSSGKT